MKIGINKKRPLHLFEGYGVEMEYIIVDKTTLNVLPISDRLLQRADGEFSNEISRHGMAWSNELVMHLIEIKTDGAALSFAGLGDIFHQEVRAINNQLANYGARLMPGAIHPWMNPYEECTLWPHEYNAIYEAYDRIFDCSGHGWANLQSTHLNLPFTGDTEFAKLHAAVRVIMPLIPALAASSPIADTQKQEFLDFRMEKYRTNSIRIPSITGWIIPEPVFSKKEYQKQIFDVMYQDIAPFDPDDILRDEWLNSRGAMARWDRNTIEIRVIDIQEHPGADIAILEWTVALTQVLVNELWCSTKIQKSWSEQDLYHILMKVVKQGEHAVIDQPEYLKLFGVSETEMTAGRLCENITSKLATSELISDESLHLLEIIFRHGSLSSRILNALPASFSREDLFPVFEQLSDCLRDGKPFIP